jgi:BirA family transcriptional regulator, biotin operon repressor / biotin---[acetyl-CoA-carboxylase] ligase
MSPAERLDPAKLTAALKGQLVGNRIVVLEETTSTNDIVAQLAPEAAEGLVVFAERQTAGRGQYGRRWESATGKGLWLSILLRPEIRVADSAKLTDLLAAAIASTLTSFADLKPWIKPPNDVYIGSRKLAGVLVEMRVEPNGNYCAIAGAGVNVNHTPDDFPPELRETAGSIANCLGREVDRQEFALALLREIDARYRAFSSNSAARAAS